MARQTLVLDASVGVKWFSDIGEAHVPQARALLTAHASGAISLMVPELFFHEISNALVYKSTISTDVIEEAIATLFDLRLTIFPVSKEHFITAVRLARKVGITEYDACYAIAAIETCCPLVTANPRHHRQALGCQIIPIEEWSINGSGGSLF
jgi:predicted nucleic acid-binding protein